MRIVHLFKDFEPPVFAGITRYIRDVADATAMRGHEVEVHVAGVRVSRRDLLPSGVVVHRHRELGRALSSPLSPGLAIAAARVDADVVHVHLPNPITEIGLLRRRTSPTVLTFHAQLGRQAGLEPLYGPVRRAVLRRASAVLVSSEAMAGVPELATATDRVEVLPFGVTPAMWPDAVAPPPPADHLRVLVVGRLVYYKGIDVLVRAIEGTSASLTIVGSGPLRDQLAEQIDAAGLGGRIEIVGSVADDQLSSIYARHDVFVLPSVSRAEAFGMATIEAMAHGRPAITTALGTATDWVNLDGESGLVVPPGDVEALRAALVRLEDPALRSTLGAGARARAERLFRFGPHLERLLAIYAEVAS